MTVLKENLRFETLRHYRGPGLFLGGGIVAGLLFFLVWLALLPSSDKTKSATEPVASGNPALDPLSAHEGVLGDITGGPGPANRQPVMEPGMKGVEENPDGVALTDSTEELEIAPEPPPMSDEEAIAMGLLGDAPAQLAEPPPPGVQTYYVEVMAQLGVVEMLEVTAESPESARALVRQLRGNPRIMRGPSTQPLD